MFFKNVHWKFYKELRVALLKPQKNELIGLDFIIVRVQSSCVPITYTECL